MKDQINRFNFLPPYFCFSVELKTSEEQSLSMETPCSPRYPLCWLAVKVCSCVDVFRSFQSRDGTDLSGTEGFMALQCVFVRGVGLGGKPSWICSL